MRVAGKGLIDRGQKIRFRFDGRSYSGFAGDTVASALLASGVKLMGRSFKYHRPRGPLTAGSEEPNALITTGRGGRREPNVRATQQEIWEGLESQSQNAWPTLDFDMMAVNDLAAPFLGAGFYYKTFMWPRTAWEALYEPVIRKAAGLGALSGKRNPDAYERVRCRGNDLASLAATQGFRPLAPQLAIRQQTVTLPVTNPAFTAVGALGAFNRYYNFTPRALLSIPALGPLLETVTTEVAQVALTADTRVTRVSIGGAGGLEMATIPGEATNTFGQFIRDLAAQANPDATVMLLGLTQNSFGYILPEEEFSYIDLTGETGFLVPFTGYEEFVSLGPLTAPLLRLQGYIPLFDAPASAAVPDYLRGCVDPAAGNCLLVDIALRLEFVQDAYAERCREAGVPEAFCGLLDPDTPLAPLCSSLGLPDAVCGLLGDGG